MKEFKHIPDSTYSKCAAPKVVNSDGIRQYKVGEKLFPSITSILSRIMESEGLDAWKERVGLDVANHICQSAINRGNIFHKICEAYLSNNCVCKFENHLLEFGMFEQAQAALDRISNIVGSRFCHSAPVAGGYCHRLRIQLYWLRRQASDNRR